MDIVLLDVRRSSGLADYYVVASVESSTQLQAAQDHIDEGLSRDFGVNPVHREGRRSASWSVLDYGGLVVHLMHQSAREFYGLERLWTDARRLNWENEERAKPRKAISSKPRKKR